MNRRKPELPPEYKLNSLQRRRRKLALQAEQERQAAEQQKEHENART
jgi:hypothetical protein